MAQESLCEPSVFERIYKEHSKPLYRFLYYKYGDEAKSEDAVQEVFAKLWQRCSEYTLTNIKSLIYTAAKNLMLNELQKSKVRLNYASSNEHSAYAESPEFALEEKQFKMQLEKAINQLTVNERQVFLMNRIDQLTYAEIANQLDISQKAVEKRMHQALMKLQNELKVSLKRK